MFRKTLLLLAALATLSTLTACDSTASLDELREATPQGDEYSKALAAGYREYAENKATSYEWETSRYFADKGLMAAYGRDITPEDPSNWELSAAALPELGEARTKLAEAITANRATQPEMAAAAVVAYDKWLVLAYNDSSPGAIAGQREAFYAILTKLSEAQAAATENVPTTTIPAETTSTVLYFPMDSDHLGDTAQAALAQLVNYVKSAGNVTVTINGHADRVGSEQYNLDLSQRRARFVVGALKQAGISEQLLKYFAFGESDPAVPTEDGVAEPRNRRVEIFIE
jgi:OmpA-OmpF porin, OOP family